MGQRLNLEITAGEEVLANAYYHWSGYTSSALRLTNIVLEHINEVKDVKDNIFKACKLLKCTGANFTQEEIEFVKEYMDDYYKELYDEEDIVSRNDGLLSITEQGIKETRIWEEARVTIDIENETINFNAVWIESKEEYMDYYTTDPDTLPTTDIDFSNIPFDDFEEFSNELNELLKNECAVRYNDSIIVFIE